MRQKIPDDRRRDVSDGEDMRKSCKRDGEDDDDREEECEEMGQEGERGELEGRGEQDVDEVHQAEGAANRCRC